MRKNYIENQKKTTQKEFKFNNGKSTRHMTWWRPYVIVIRLQVMCVVECVCGFEWFSIRQRHIQTSLYMIKVGAFDGWPQFSNFERVCVCVSGSIQCNWQWFSNMSFYHTGTGTHHQIGLFCHNFQMIWAFYISFYYLAAHFQAFAWHVLFITHI